MARILFGAETVKTKMSNANFHMDSWFTGADFPHAALVLIETAVRRRNFHLLVNIVFCACGVFV